MSIDVVVVGSIIVDYISYVPRLPIEGETIHGTKFATGYGGKGCNQAVAARKLGSKTAILCKLGDDSWGRDYLAHLNALGIETKYIQTVPEATTGVAQICVSTATGANHIVIVGGANDHLTPTDVEQNQGILEGAKVLLCQLETPIDSTIRALEMMKGISILNAAPGLKDLPERLLKLPTIFCCNESEATLITGLPVSSITSAREAALKLREMGCRTVIITLGADGAVFLEEGSSDQVHHVEMPPVDCVKDTTGAGDCFLGALAHSLAAGDAGLSSGGLQKAIEGACLIAGISVQRLGTQSSFPVADEVVGVVNQRLKCHLV